MGISAKARRAPLRLTTGAYVLNTGIATFGVDDDASARLQSTVATYVPQANRLDPRTFSKVVAAGEVTLGTALLLPIVPTAAAGLALTAFGGSLLATRWRTPDATSAPAVTDAWLTGSGASLLLDALVSPAHDKRVEVSATLHEKAAAKRRFLRRARRRAAVGDKAHAAGEKLQDASERIVELRDEYQPVAAKKLKKARKQAKAARKQAQSKLQEAVEASPLSPS
jgi:hypothetical protein